MAGLGRKQWAGGELVNVGDMQGYLQDQTVMVFADAAARAAAVPSPTQGMLSYLRDASHSETYTGSAWQVVGAGVSALYTTNGIALAAGDNTVNLTTLLAGDGGMFPLVGGAVTTAIGGTFLLIYDFDIDGFNTQIMGGPATVYPGETASVTAAAVNGLSHASLHTMVVRQAAASEAFPKPYARVMPNGANATIRLTVVFQG